MARGRGQCSACRATFAYQLIHNGFNDTAYAYCESCGSTALLSCWFPKIPPDSGLKVHGPISEEVEPLLLSCDCGGRFRADAVPRCLKCRAVLSATEARSYIEADHQEGVREGWRWQGSWQGTYCIIVGGRVVNDNWRAA